jgi:hypothetical protein
MGTQLIKKFYKTEGLYSQLGYKISWFRQRWVEEYEDSKIRKVYGN